ncbi:MAG TPA: preprotein translocase subunit SecE [Acidobacteriaceae bacterium]|nr:preprotein translocase subunit SecE [Acidobacteriaceae bacterium]
MSKAAVAPAHTEETNSTIQQVTAGPQRLVEFLKETRSEMRKVVVPTRTEVRSNTIVVLVTVFFFAAFFEVVDLIFGKGIDQVFLHLTKH